MGLSLSSLYFDNQNLLRFSTTVVAGGTCFRRAALLVCLLRARERPASKTVTISNTTATINDDERFQQEDIDNLLCLLDLKTLF